MKDGFIRVAASSPRIRVADPENNINAFIQKAKEAASDGVRVLIFPELSVCGYTANDLLFSDILLRGCEAAVTAYLRETADLPLLSFLGVPVQAFGRLYNCAAAVCGGKLLGLVPKHALGNYGEFCESRWFARPERAPVTVTYAGQQVQLGCDQIFCCAQMPSLAVAAEICEDIWVSTPISCHHTAAGATLVVNLCASDEFFGKSELRRNMTLMQSRKSHCAYVLCDAGEGESVTDMVFSGNHIMCQMGEIISEKPPFSEGDTLVATLDMGLVENQRLRANFTPKTEGYLYHRFSLPVGTTVIDPLPARFPFIPADGSGCDTVLAIQSAALASRMRHVGAKRLLLGISGGLDSTLALLVSVMACRKVGLPASAVHALTLPCFGTSARTRGNAQILCEALGVSFDCVDIRQAVTQHLSDIGHPLDLYDAAYENAQARERTQVLMDLANAEGGLVVGTGDLSELALGWATYGGDHLSMYAVNASVPKTLIRHVLSVYADRCASTDPTLSQVLCDIVNTPVSPELLPPKEGEISQITEDLVGPYELHDFFIWHTLRGGASPKKVYRLACAAFADVYTPGQIKATLQIFVRRFLSQQFKRSCMPDGPKVTHISLSPRGDLRMPSDACANLWMKELNEI